MSIHYKSLPDWSVDWVVVEEPGGRNHRVIRATQRLQMGERVVSGPHGYLYACKVADDLNSVSEVIME